MSRTSRTSPSPSKNPRSLPSQLLAGQEAEKGKGGKDKQKGGGGGKPSPSGKGKGKDKGKPPLCFHFVFGGCNDPNCRFTHEQPRDDAERARLKAKMEEVKARRANTPSSSRAASPNPSGRKPKGPCKGKEHAAPAAGDPKPKGPKGQGNDKKKQRKDRREKTDPSSSASSASSSSSSAKSQRSKKKGGKS